MNLIEKIKKFGEEMTCAQTLVDMANSEYRDALKSKDRGMDAAYTLALGRRRGIIMAVEALGVIPTCDVETGLYHL